MKLLFICNQNKDRSKTAKDLFRNRFETKSAGLFNENSVSKKELSWADIIFVMEDHQREELSKRFPEIYLKKQIISLNIPDIYHYNQEELINLLNNKFDDIIQAIH